MGDIIIIWRVFAFWMGPNDRWLLAIPLAVLLSSIGRSPVCTGFRARSTAADHSIPVHIVTLFMVIDCSVKSKGQLLLGNFDSGPYCQHVQSASYFANTLTTLVATIMISYKTWCVHISIVPWTKLR